MKIKRNEVLMVVIAVVLILLMIGFALSLHLGGGIKWN
jgi:ABC-type transporter Mla subunit MlaD